VAAPPIGEAADKINDAASCPCAPRRAEDAVEAAAAPGDAAVPVAGPLDMAPRGLSARP
jgi:hypothetical protein